MEDSLNLRGRNLDWWRFYAKNFIGLRRLFKGYPSLTPSFEGNPLTQGHEIS